jgi:cellulose synthase/poly-beta-1,6-N-acetylglucosamine synthase-like glycosyltransferase
VPSIASLPFVSVIVPARNEADNIARTVRNLRALSYPEDRLEVIVVDDGSTDETAAIAKAAGASRVIRNERAQKAKVNGKASALNAGLAAARGDIIACVDADSMPEKDAIMHSVPFFEDSSVGAVTSKIFVNSDRKWLGKLQRIEYAMIAWSRKLFEYIDSIYVTPGPLSFYRKSVLKEVGGFDEKNVTEDIEIAWRLLDRGYRIKMSPAITYTEIPQSFRHWWKQRIRWNVGGIQTSMKYKGSMFRKGSFGSFVLPFFTLSYALSLLALSIFMYLIYIWAFKNLQFFVSAYSVGLNPVSGIEPFFLPDMFTIFGILVFGFAVAIVNFGMKEMNESRKPGMWLYVLVYLSVYITLFPIILVHSFIRYFRGWHGW